MRTRFSSESVTLMFTDGKDCRSNARHSRRHRSLCYRGIEYFLRNRTSCLDKPPVVRGP